MMHPEFDSPELEYLQRCLSRSIIQGDWDRSKLIFLQHEDCFRYPVFEGNTAIHLAVLTMRPVLVHRLIDLLGRSGRLSDLLVLNDVGRSSLYMAASSGSLEIATMLYEANQDLLLLRDEEGELPIHASARLGHGVMVGYLFELCRNSLNDKDKTKLFFSCIKSRLYGFANHLLEDWEFLAFARDDDEKPHADDVDAVHFAAVHILVQKTNKSNESEGGVELFRRLLGKIVGNPKVRGKDISIILEKPNVLFLAIKYGNYAAVQALIYYRPELIFTVEEGWRSAFHLAVEHRQGKILQLLKNLGGFNYILTSNVDPNTHDTILHLAARLPPSSSSCLEEDDFQMQGEIEWFEEIEAFAPNLAVSENLDNKFPRDLFLKDHKDLHKQESDMMRDMARAGSTVSALITSSVFAARVVVPASQPLSGISAPSPSSESHLTNWIWIFAISTSWSLSLAILSLVSFLSVLISIKFTQKGFRYKLPLKLFLGLLFLFVSLIPMLIAYVSIFAILYDSEKTWKGTAAVCSLSFFGCAAFLFPFLRRYGNSIWKLMKRVKPFWRRTQ